jgi:hypothetical protein
MQVTGIEYSATSVKRCVFYNVKKSEREEISSEIYSMLFWL